MPLGSMSDVFIILLVYENLWFKSFCRGLDSISFISAELNSRHYLQYLVQFIHVKRNPLGRSRHKLATRC